ncbi:hypothetical protein ACLKA6_000734 [Drosophila palustris]
MEEQQQQQQQHQQHQQQQQQQQQQQHQQHQHQHQNQCDPAVPNGQYTGSKSALQMLKVNGVLPNCHMLTATPTRQQHWLFASERDF